MVIPDSVKKAYDYCTEYLKKAGAEAPAFEVSVLMEDLLGVPKGAYITLPDGVFTEEQLSVLKNAVLRRAEGCPLQYILGSWEFYGRNFFVGEGVLIPRQETEHLCETVLKFYRGKKPPEIIDLCSGSGCVAITLAKELSGAKVTAVELYPAAFAYLERNNELYGNPVRAICGDALSPFGEFDCVVSNPPYVTALEMSTLQKELSYEPENALTDGGDGLSFYREIAEKWKPHLRRGGLLAFEIGDTQGEAVLDILTKCGYSAACVTQDYSGNDRVASAVKE